MGAVRRSTKMTIYGNEKIQRFLYKPPHRSDDGEREHKDTRRDSVDRAKRFLYKPPHHSVPQEQNTHDINPKNYTNLTLPADNSERPKKPSRLTVSIIMERLLELESEVVRLNTRLERMERENAACLEA